MTRERRTIEEFHHWLEGAFETLDLICANGFPDGCDQLLVADLVEEAYRLACRFGGGQVVGQEFTSLHPRDGLAVMGRLLTWVEERIRSRRRLLTVEQVASMLGVSARTIWRWVSAGQFPQPIQVGGSTRWRRDQVEEYISGECV